MPLLCPLLNGLCPCIKTIFSKTLSRSLHKDLDSTFIFHKEKIKRNMTFWAFQSFNISLQNSKLKISRKIFFKKLLIKSSNAEMFLLIYGFAKCLHEQASITTLLFFIIIFLDWLLVSLKQWRLFCFVLFFSYLTFLSKINDERGKDNSYSVNETQTSFDLAKRCILSVAHITSIQVRPSECVMES